MKLSLIIPTYKGEKFIQTLVNSFNAQSDKDFEVIFVVDSTKEESPLKYLLKLRKKKKNPIKILFNSKRQKRLTSIMSGIQKATGQYIAICSTKDSISNDFVKKINQVITKHKPDVIEYEFKYGKQKIEPELLTPKNVLINCKKNSSVIAYTIPFDFNKVIKRSLAKKFAQIEYLDGGSRFDFSFIFHLMLEAKTYFAISSILKTTEVFSKTLIGPRKMLKVVNQSIQQFEFKKNDDLHDAILYQG
jgi:glycosyltransferase involved in cell wall biosynthesis